MWEGQGWTHRLNSYPKKTIDEVALRENYLEGIINLANKTMGTQTEKARKTRPGRKTRVQMPIEAGHRGISRISG